jgi:hypothetical protein
LNVGWYVVFKEGNETLTQTAEDRDEAILVACDVYLRGHLVLSIGSLGRGAVSDNEIEGVELQDLIRKQINEEHRK